jgi:hypothetical protein
MAHKFLIWEYISIWKTSRIPDYKMYSCATEFSHIIKKILQCYNQIFNDLKISTLNSYRYIDWILMSYMSSYEFVWVRRCVLRLNECMKEFGHCKHLKGFSPVWNRRWDLKLDDRLKDFGHWKHLKGFSPVWVRRCVLNADDWLKDLGHCKHLKGFSLVFS